MIVIVAIPPAAVTIAGTWPPLHRPFQIDRAAHFLIYAAPVFAALGLAALALRRRPLALLMLSGTVIASAMPILAGDSLRTLFTTGANASERTLLRVVTFNAHSRSTLHDRAFVEWLLAQNADLVAIVDAPGGLFNTYPELAQAFPHRVEPRRGRLWPIVLLSRRELRVVRLTPTDNESRTSYVANSTARIALDHDKSVLFTAMHPFSPRNPKAWRRSIEIVRRDGDILRAAQQRYGDAFIVAGDFNSTPIGRTFHEFAEASGFHTSSWPLPATWPADLPRFIGVAIDHIWVSPGIDIVSRRVGPSFRSDHRPVVMDVLLPSSTPQAAIEPDPPSR